MIQAMKSFFVENKTHGLKLVSAICLHYPGLRPASVLKALQSKDIRVNGTRTSVNMPVFSGDEVAVYLPDTAFSAVVQYAPSHVQAQIAVMYEDENFIIVHKPAGMAVHAGKTIAGNTLIELLRKSRNNTELTLCHRLDMNTGGLLLVAKNAKAADNAMKAFRSGQIHKRYRCLVRGVPRSGNPVRSHDGVVMYELKGYLEKKPNTPEVFVHDHPQKGDLDITTRYRVVQIIPGLGPKGEDLSELEVEPVTGRTHQIRAHMAHIGHPLLGDGKYGRNAYNKHFRSRSGKLKTQQLHATSLQFEKTITLALMRPLAGKMFKIAPDYDLEGLPF